MMGANAVSAWSWTQNQIFFSLYNKKDCKDLEDLCFQIFLIPDTWHKFVSKTMVLEEDFIWKKFALKK